MDLDVDKLTPPARVSEPMLDMLSEAAAVQLDIFHARPGPGEVFADIYQPRLSASPAARGSVSWTPPTHAARQTHCNSLDATESAAYAVAIALVQRLGFVVVSRAHHGSGADWLMFRVGEPENDFWKLEVSGIERTTGDWKVRLAAKVAQVGSGNLDRPGLSVVVRFEDLVIAHQET